MGRGRRSVVFVIAAAWCAVLLASRAAYGQSVFVNELHYDNVGTDAGEAIEIAGPAGTDLSGWTLVLYNGANGLVYNTLALSGVVPDQENGFGTLAFSYPVNGIQNGSPDGIALVDYASQIVQFLSYEGSFTAVGGPADGMISTDIGVRESGTTPVGFSLQLRGTGLEYTDFAWSAEAANSFGAVNDGQVFSAPIPPPEVTIMTIQGSGHTSPLVGQRVSTTGVVTALAPNGFYLQDFAGDGDPDTSDGVFVFTSAAPTVQPGDTLRVIATVQEFIPGGAATNNLSTTELATPAITLLATGTPLPPPTVIGVGGRIPPTSVIDDDNFAVFDPSQDGIDFYESLEGMRVTVRSPTVVGPTNQFGEIFVVAGGGGATGLNARGGITIGPDDFNPERIQIDSLLVPGGLPVVNVGDRLSDVTGVVSYSFGNFEVLPSVAPTAIPGNLARETTPLTAQLHKLTVATFNVKNLDPSDGPRFNELAQLVVSNLLSPDILMLEEVQDNDGATNDGVVDATVTFQTLIAAIQAAGGPSYAFRDIAPVDGQDGGEPGGNIRVGFLFNPARVTFVDRGTPSSTTGTSVFKDATGTHLTLSPGRIDPTNPAFDDSRKPLAGEFIFEQNRLFVIGNHFTSKGGSSPLFGTVQPIIDGGHDQRVAQARVVHDFAQAVLDLDPQAKIVALGDLNDFWFSDVLSTLRGGDTPILANLQETLPQAERYTFIFEGNSQALDHVLTSPNLSQRAGFDIVHVNAEYAVNASDHDPSLARFALLPGDLNGDACVDIRDVALLLRAVRDHSRDTVTYDFNHDGRVTALGDGLALARGFSRPFGVPCRNAKLKHTR